jgi:hypothetical protein
MERKGLFKEEEKMQAIQGYKNNLLVPYVLLNAQTPEKGNLLEYYRGKKGIFVRTTANNMEERFQRLLQNPEMRNNFVMTNIYIDIENSGREIEFKLKNTDVDENSKSYRLAFLEGLNSPNPEVKSFFEDLGMGSYLQYAGSYASGHVSTIVPHEVYVSHTTNAFNKLTELKDTDSAKFDAYLSLVRFSTKMALETAGPIKGLSTFFVSNYAEMAKTITGLSPEVLKLYKNRENLTSGKVESLQQSPSTSVEVIPLNESQRFTRESAEKDTEYMYLFTDNAGRTSGSGVIDPNSWYAKKYGADKKYASKTQAVARGLKNVYPITTMVDDKRTQWTDDQFNEYKKIIDDEIETIKQASKKYNGIKFGAEMPFGKGAISNMKDSAPKIWNYLNTKLAEIGIDNTGDIPVSTQPSTSVNLLVEAGVKPTDMAGNAAKDIQMASESTQFIGFQSGTATVSSTNKYKEAWGDKANTGNYTADDVVMVSGSGLFRGVTEAQIKETLTNKYKPLLEQAIAAGASFRVGNQYAKGNLSDQLIAQYLKTKGYQEEKFNGYSKWTPKVTETSQEIQKEVIENFEEDSDVTDTNVPNTPTQFPPTKTDDIQLTLKLDPDQKDDDKGNLDDLGFEEDTCEIV